MNGKYLSARKIKIFLKHIHQRKELKYFKIFQVPNRQKQTYLIINKELKIVKETV
jgi:hypothetical protein